MTKKKESEYIGLLFNRQWYLGRNKPNSSFEWNKFSLADEYILYTHINQKVSITKTGDTSGIAILGIAFNPEALEDTKLLSVVRLVQNPQALEDEIIKLAGSYVIIIFSDEEIKIYNDAAGFMGVYYTDKVAASTPNLISPVIRDKIVDQDFNFGNGNDWYTGSTTPYVNIKKMIPNCSLCLNNCSIKRYWPANHNFPDNNNAKVNETIYKITDLLEKMMVGVVARGDVLSSITGGQDSRVVLAASKPVWDEIQYFTLQGPAIQETDVTYAKMLAKKVGLNHKIHRVTPTENWLYELYDTISADESIGARREVAGTCLQLGGSNVVHVNGNLGAICKSYYWDRKKTTSFKTSAVMRDFVAPGQTTVNGVKEWRKTVPDLKATVLYNLFYLEQRGGRWMAAGENASRLFYESFSPFNHRQLFTYICSLPIELQYGGNLLRTLTKKMAPELLDIPFSKARRRWTKYIPEKIKNKVRKLKGAGKNI